MIPITIAARFRPFTHHPGVYFILPGTALRVQVFPALLQIDDLSQQKPTMKVLVEMTGPVKDFTVQQDLERGCISIWGETAGGFMRYCLTTEGDRVKVQVDKAPSKELFKRESVITLSAPAHPTPSERLSLGSHKAQDWELMQRRSDMAEIFPLWLRLGQFTPSTPYQIQSDSLLDCCDSLIQKRERTAVLPAFHDLFLAGFDMALSPRATDQGHHGFTLPPLSSHHSALQLLTHGAALIRRLFVQSAGDDLHLLPLLPPEFHSGRFIGANCEWVTVDLEWSKHLLQRMVLTAQRVGEISLHFQKELRSFRLRCSLQERGKKVRCGTAIAVEPGVRYLLDHFEK